MLLLMAWLGWSQPTDDIAEMRTACSEIGAKLMFNHTVPLCVKPDGSVWIPQGLITPKK